MVTKKAKKTVSAVKKASTTTKKKSTAKTAKKTVAVKKVAEVKKQVCEQAQQETNNNSYVIIDHPVEGETIYGDNYVLRIGASFDGYVEVSFNDGEWQPCRFASGYWWYDWMYYKSGNVKIVARLVCNDGKILKISDIRKCKVA